MDTLGPTSSPPSPLSIAEDILILAYSGVTIKSLHHEFINAFLPTSSFNNHTILPTMEANGPALFGTPNHNSTPRRIPNTEEARFMNQERNTRGPRVSFNSNMDAIRMKVETERKRIEEEKRTEEIQRNTENST
jgi:hypothetical protein